MNGRNGYDLAVVGAGICGLAHALAAARRGKRVVVIDRDAQANGASIRNFGFVTITGQQRGQGWQRALRSRDVWREIAEAAGIRVEHRGLAMVVRLPESVALLAAFLRTEMGAGCELLEPSAARTRMPMLARAPCAAVLWSPHEIRVESRAAVPAVARYLAEALGVTFMRETQVRSVDPPTLETSRGHIRADTAVVCPGDDFLTLFPERLAAYGLTRCKLHMLRVAPPADGLRLQAAIMSDLGLVRYLGYAELPEAEALRSRLAAEQPEHLANGVHLIAVQNADGSLIVGNSHHYGTTPDPFAPELVDTLILEEFEKCLGLRAGRVIDRWLGEYASAADRLMLVDRPSDAVRIVVITSGTGASTSFAIGEEVVAELYG